MKEQNIDRGRSERRTTTQLDVTRKETEKIRLDIQEEILSKIVWMEEQKKAFTDLERVLVKALTLHKVDKEVTKVILLRLMDNKVGQDMLIQYLMNAKELKGKDILTKTKEIQQQTAKKQYFKLLKNKNENNRIYG